MISLKTSADKDKEAFLFDAYDQSLMEKKIVKIMD